jgi:hypothetical protein
MFALPPIADIGERDRDVRFVPKAEVTAVLGYFAGGNPCGYGHVTTCVSV